MSLKQKTSTEIDNNNKSLINYSLFQHYKSSLNSSSNLTSTILLNQIIQGDTNITDQAQNVILNSANSVIEHHNGNKLSHWRSSLSTFTDPLTLFNKSIPNCQQCDIQGLQEFSLKICKCNAGNSHQTKTNISDTHSQESVCNEIRIAKPKFNRFRPKKSVNETVPINSSNDEKNISRPKPYSNNTISDEDEEKAHKHQVAKITFKTAREQLLASNPAAKRTLGASRKAQAKFVSPMLGAQDKQESCDPSATDDRLKHIDPKMVELIESEILDKGAPIEWDDIAGLQMAKSVIQEAVVWPLLRPDIFTGLRRPPKGILLFGPPGTGKTMIGRCVARVSGATFFSISSSSLTSKWLGDGEKMVRALFAVARCHQPAVIFIDEIDSLLTQRSDSEHEATRRIKTEFLVQFDGAATAEEDRLLIVGATNRPHELDEAARRRLVKRLYIPLPDAEAREQMINNLLKSERHELSPREVREVARRAAGYSGADVKALCSEAAMGPVRAVPLAEIVSIDRSKVRAVNIDDFMLALQRVRPSVSPDDLDQYVKWDQTYGQGV